MVSASSLLVTQNGFAKTVQELCQNARDVQIVKSREDFRREVCEIKQIGVGSQEVSRSADDVLKIFSHAPKKNWDRDAKLQKALLKLSVAYGKALQLPLATPASESEKLTESQQKLAVKLQEFLSKYPTPEIRIQKKEMYLEEMKEVLSLTKSGKEGLKCLADLKGAPLISSLKVLFKSDPKSAKYWNDNSTMGINQDIDPQAKGKYQVNFRFNEEMNPIGALTMFGHELTHLCHESERCEWDVKVRQSKGVKAKAALVEFDQVSAIDELRAYRAENELYKEFAEVDPVTFCTRSFVSQHFGLQVKTSADTQNAIEKNLQKGTFLRDNIELYLKHGFYSRPESILKMKNRNVPLRDAHGNVMLRDDLKEKARGAGFVIQ